NYVGFLGALGVIDATNPVETNWTPGLRTRFVLQTVASVKYWLYRGDWAQVPMLAATYRAIGTAGDITMLENTQFVPLGFGVRQVVRESAFHALQPTRKDVTLLHAAMVPDGAATRLAAFDTTSIALPYGLAAYAADA